MDHTVKVETGVHLRQAGVADIPALAAVHLSTVLEAYGEIFPPEADKPSLAGTVAEWGRAFSEDGHVAFLAEEGAEAIGTVSVRTDPHARGAGELCRLHVLPGRSGRGVGSGLHDMALSAMAEAGYERAGLWVLEEAASARSFYERRGWRLVAGQVFEWPGHRTREVRYSRGLGAAEPDEG